MKKITLMLAAGLLFASTTWAAATPYHHNGFSDDHSEYSGKHKYRKRFQRCHYSHYKGYHCHRTHRYEHDRRGRGRGRGRGRSSHY
jgi:hypothetical protein